MTQEQKELLLKDLCMRLPYGTMVYAQNATDWYDSEICTQVLSDVINEDYIVKPYLFPLSNMTEEQEKEYEDALVYHDYVKGGWTIAKTFDNEYVVPYWFVDFCNEHHFDYRGLIPMGLAIDATGLNIY